LRQKERSIQLLSSGEETSTKKKVVSDGLLEGRKRELPRKKGWGKVVKGQRECEKRVT